MTKYSNLKFEDLYKYEPHALNFFLNFLSASVKKKFSAPEIQTIYRNNAILAFTGNGPYESRELNYGVFYHKINYQPNEPIRIVMKSIFSTSAHKDLINKGGVKNLVVAGILVNNQFSSYSSTWIKMYPKNTPGHIFGTIINTIFLKCYGIK